MELELRDKEGNFMFSAVGSFANVFANYLQNEPRITLEDKILNGKKFRCFCNKTNETISGKNDFVSFIIKPGSYVKIMF